MAADFGSHLLAFPYLLHCRPLQAVFGKEVPCGIMVYNPHRHSVSLVCLVLLHPGHQQLASLLPAQEGWKTVVHAHRASACSEVGSPSCGDACAIGPGLDGHSLIPSSFPILTILVILWVIAWRNPATWLVPVMVRVCCIRTALPWNYAGLVTFAASAPFSPSTRAHFSLSISYTVKVLPGVLLYGSLVYKYICLRVISVDETIPVSHSEAFYCS